MKKLNPNIPVAAALGNFDGMHIGHMAVLKKAEEYREQGFEPRVILFDEHTRLATDGKTPPMLMTAFDREKVITDSGFDISILNFEEIRTLSPESFVKDILIGRLNVGAVVCGYNYRFGFNAQGTAHTMQQLCEKNSIMCSVVGEVDSDNEPVSSTFIRSLIENGEIEKANRMLGRPFGFCSEVIDGDKRGRTWGFPTINQVLPDNLVMPKFGVYATEVTVDGIKYIGVTNIGKRPTVGTEKTLSETNILEFNQDVYGKAIDIRLKKFIRAEEKFSSFDELKIQIADDIRSVKRGEINV